MVLSLPRLLGTAWDSAQKQYAMFNSALAGGDIVDAAVRILAMAAVALPVVGIFYILFRLVRQVVTALWQKTRGKALQRGIALTLVAAVTAGLAWAWWPDAETYRPVQPYERGTLADATTAVFPASATTGMREGQAGRTVALWPAGAEKPTREQPQLSMVLVPRDAGTAGTEAPPSWVFPFDRPAAPEEDGNQALAVNTTDGSVVYDVAFALVWAEDGEDVTTRNEAYAFASCADCAAVAVGFQVVLIVGQTDVIVPENLSAAANYNCLRCLTYALASQLVLTLDGPLSAEGMTRLNALWQQIAEYGRNLQDVPLSEIQGRLDAFKLQIMEVIRSDPSAAPGGSTGTAPAPTVSPSPGASQTAAPGATPGATDAAPQPGTTAPAATAEATAPAAPQPTGTATATVPPPAAPTGTAPATAPAP
jgi:putative peptide zinc metalloprotease protein